MEEEPITAEAVAILLVKRINLINRELLMAGKCRMTASEIAWKTSREYTDAGMLEMADHWRSVAMVLQFEDDNPRRLMSAYCSLLFGVHGNVFSSGK